MYSASHANPLSSISNGQLTPMSRAPSKKSAIKERVAQPALVWKLNGAVPMRKELNWITVESFCGKRDQNYVH
ncbi:Hypothetical predicted protein [Pelobates cultripes]|uniref:Uncharacterized protein n=2 Tax=Pelobates cultripes TaxID=61616 RepID=A0AAD1TMZ2_PELCU|nr:Hypothetical predicted protein [Pelobates cultripes]